MRTPRKPPQLIVRCLSLAASRGVLEVGALRFPCALGRSGIKVLKTEGDGATPRGCFELRQVLYNAARSPRPRTRLPVRAVRRNDGWCDAPADRNYNRPVRHPYAASAEHLWRDDNVYDVVVVLDYNVVPRRRGRGSAVFMHVARDGFAATEGCIALRSDHLRRLLTKLPPKPSLNVRAR